MLRLFIAVDLPAAERQAAAALCAGVQGARWANPQQLHITLRFLGGTPEERLPAMERCLAGVRGPAFTLAARGVGVFPARARRPRVMWLGLEPGAPLVALKNRIDDALAEVAPIGPAERSGFRPHLTLARFTRPPGDSLDDFLARHASYAGTAWSVTGFHLYQSTLRQSGALHERLATYLLAEDRGHPQMAKRDSGSDEP
jgi:2'-5' RNA ligase